MIWIETPTNPTMKMVDIAAVSKLLKSRPDIISVVDNTFMSSYFQVVSLSVFFGWIKSVNWFRMSSKQVSHFKIKYLNKKYRYRLSGGEV